MGVPPIPCDDEAPSMSNHIPHDPARRPDRRPDQCPDHNKEKGDQPARNLPDKHPVPPSVKRHNSESDEPPVENY
jgi:hypothetical protein